jgi:transposase
VAGDKGYSSPPVRRYLKERRVGVVIPTKADQVPDPSFDREAYRERNVVERLINRLKQFRRIATRYEKRAVNYLAMATPINQAVRLGRHSQNRMAASVAIAK